MKFLTTMTLMWVLTLVFVTAGCGPDAQSALNDGFAASVRVSSYGTDLTKAFTQLRHTGAISQEVFDGIIAKLKLVDVAGHKVEATLKAWVTQYPDGNVPPDIFSPVSLLFNSDIYGPVMEVVGMVLKLSPANQAFLSVALTGIKLAVGTIRTLVNKHSAALGLPEIKEFNYGIA